ncbi:aspartate beta-hydroxylase domain-containing protein 2-like [Ciona intestinalis]
MVWYLYYTVGTWISGFWLRVFGCLLLILLIKLSQLKSNNYKRCSNTNCLCCGKSNSVRDKFKAEIKSYSEIPNSFKNWVNEDYTLPLQNGQHPMVFYLPGVRTQPLIDSLHYEDDMQILKDNYNGIKGEYEKLIGDLSCWKTNSTPQGEWSLFYLVNQGKEIAINCEQCPVTTSVLRSMGSIMGGCGFGNACFSIVKPGTMITEHCGPCNVRTRCHFGLNIPDGFELLINDESYYWSERECLFFDDSFPHSVISSDHKVHGSNTSVGSSDYRAVFMVDFWHHNLSSSEISLIKKLFPAQ